MWSQGYDPLGNAVLSTLVAATPIIVLLATLGLLKWKAHKAALIGLATALVIAILVFGMPPTMAIGTEPMTNGQINRQEPWPACVNIRHAVPATNRLSNSAAVDMRLCSHPASAISAR